MRGATDEVRFFSHVERGECWNWTAATNHAGYGVFGTWNPRKQVRAHRWAYEYFIGPIPEGLQIDHLCRNRMCVRPDHLEAVTPKVNTQRGSNHNRDKAICVRGHSLYVNIYIDKLGRRVCRDCHRIHRENRRRRMEAQ